MNDMTNSQRRLYKATYAPTKIKDDDGDNQSQQPEMRAFEKLNFVQSLAIHPSELARLRGGLIKHKEEPATRELLEAIDVIEKVVKDPSPAKSIYLAASFGQIRVETLLQLAKLLADKRLALIRLVESSLERIRMRYAARQQQITRVTIPTDTETAPTAPTLQRGIEASHSTEAVADTIQVSPAEGVVTPGPAQSKVNEELKTSRENTLTRTPALGLPSVEEAIEWAAVHEANRIRPLQSLALSFAPVSPVYSNAGTVAVLTNLLLKLKEIHTLTIGSAQAFDQRFKIQPVGRLHLERLDMTPIGVERGELLYSVPLTPKETVNISHKEWSTTTEEFEKITQDFFEGYSEEGVAEKDDVAMSAESQSKHSTALNVGASLSASYSSVTLSSSFGFNATSDDQQAQKDSRNHSVALTRKASSRARKDQKVTFKVSSVAGTEDMAVRVITNPSETSTMRVDYFRLMRKWRVELYRYDLRMTYDIVIPNPGSDLIRKIEELRELDALLNLPFSFDLNLTEIDRTNWPTKAAMYNASVEAPKPYIKPMQDGKFLPPKDDSNRVVFDSIDFEVEADYEVKEAWLSAFYFPITAGDANVRFEVPFHLPFSTSINPFDRSTKQYELKDLYGKNGKLSVMYDVSGVDSGEVQVSLKVQMTDDAVKQWQFKAWSAMRQAAEEQYFQSRQTLKERRAQLLGEIGSADALTLRRMEREEIMKGVLRWLFGPTFELVPADIQAMFTPIDPKDPMSTDILEPLSEKSWERVMNFGEFIKYIHQAIEWENVLAFMYPYFWDSPKNWDRKRFLNHPDSFHRDFLRAGCARVVLTIRPGFEDSFASLIETGAFGQLPGDHPYVTIAKEIQDYARTNYPGIPSANPPSGETMKDVDELTENTERGKLIARWYEYTPTSALDLAVDTALTNLA